MTLGARMLDNTSESLTSATNRISLEEGILADSFPPARATRNFLRARLRFAAITPRANLLSRHSNLLFKRRDLN